MKFEKDKLLTTVSAVALVLAVGACSSNGDDGVSAERDTALEDLKAANDKAARLAGELADEQAEVMRLEGLIGDETDPAADSLIGRLAAANARIGAADDPDSLEGMLAAEQAKVMRLEGLIGDETDPAADSLIGRLAAANARIGAADDPDSLEGMLAAEQAKVMRLEGLIGDETDPAADSFIGRLAAANARIGAADDPDSLEGMLAAEQAKVMRLGGLIGDETDPASLRGELADARAKIDSDDPDNLGLKQQLAAAKARIDNNDPDNLGLMQQLAAANKELRDRDLEVEKLERIARGQGIAAALLANRVGDTRVRVGADGKTDLTGSQLPFPTAASATDEHGVSAERSSGGVVTVSVELTDTEAVKFSGNDSNAGATWARAMQTRTLDDFEETVVIYTDIDKPTATALATEFVRPDAADQQYVLVDTALELDRIIPSEVPDAGDPQSLVYTAAEQFRGTYRGIAGEFTCGTGATCSVSTDAAGNVTVAADGDGMNFVPDEIGATHDVQDTAYVYFGWWLNMPNDADATHMVESFAGGTNPVMSVANVTGKATYEGPAAGKFVTKTLTAGVLKDADVGHFTASAKLIATFVDNKISGSVMDFLEDGKSLGPWVVKLQEGDIAPNDGTFNGDTSVTFGGLTSEEGAWQGQFYDADMDDDTKAPGRVAGTFDAHDPGGTAHISGAFGAENK